MRRTTRLGLTWLLLAGISVPLAPGPAAAGSDGLRQWFGAEAGFDEISCLGAGSSCKGLASVEGFGGDLRVQRSMVEMQDPDGVTRIWPARTGNRMFLATAPGGTPATAYLATGSGVAAPVTTSFAVRFHALGASPVAIYRHHGPDPAKAVALVLSPAGDLLLLQGNTMLPGAASVSPGDWHAVTITYGTGTNAPFKVYVDGSPAIAGVLPFGGPSGQVHVGIVSPTPVPTRIGIDDLVEWGGFDAPIHGARVHYLMPLGRIGPERWNRVHGVAACAAAGENWQMLSEDQRVRAGGQDCLLEDGSLQTSEPGRVDGLRLEGVPSRHKPGGDYGREVWEQPAPSAPVLGVRTRMRAKTNGPKLTWSLTLIEGSGTASDGFTFDGGGTGGWTSAWGATRTVRPAGGIWRGKHLDDLTLELHSGSGSGVRKVDEVRVDYVWVP